MIACHPRNDERQHSPDHHLVSSSDTFLSAVGQPCSFDNLTPSWRLLDNIQQHARLCRISSAIQTSHRAALFLQVLNTHASDTAICHCCGLIDWSRNVASHQVKMFLRVRQEARSIPGTRHYSSSWASFSRSQLGVASPLSTHNARSKLSVFSHMTFQSLAEVACLGGCSTDVYCIYLYPRIGLTVLSPCRKRR